MQFLWFWWCGRVVEVVDGHNGKLVGAGQICIMSLILVCYAGAIHILYLGCLSRGVCSDCSVLHPGP